MNDPLEVIQKYKIVIKITKKMYLSYSHRPKEFYIKQPVLFVVNM